MLVSTIIGLVSASWKQVGLTESGAKLVILRFLFYNISDPGYF